MSVGHVARLLEESGIPTVIIAVKSFQTRMEIMTLPRVLITPHPMGRPVGLPGNRKVQREIVQTALDLLQNANQAGTIKPLEGTYRI